MIEKPIIEISGLDYSGKTTQASLLSMETWRLHAHNFGSFEKYDDKIQSGISPQEHFNWWFKVLSPDEIAQLLVSSYEKRQEEIRSLSNVDLAIVERGRSMLIAQVAANYAIRLSLDPEDVLDRAIDVVENGTSDKFAREEFMLVSDDSLIQLPSKTKKYTRNFVTNLDSPFTVEQDTYYAQYLEKLKRSLGIVAREASLHLISIEQAAIDTQNKIRNHEALSIFDLPNIIPHDMTAVGIAGYSESGKSALAEKLSKDHGFTRLKLGYFNESRRDINGRYANPRKIALEVVHFIATNRHASRFSFESLYGPHLSAELKTILGDRWKSVLVKTSKDTRRNRLISQFPDNDTDELINVQMHKDEIKHDAGMSEYEEIADIIINNDGLLDETVNRLIRELFNE